LDRVINLLRQQGVYRVNAKEFNQKCPTGSPVLYYPVAGRPESAKTVTRSKAWTLDSGQVVVKIEGRAGGVSVNHIVAVRRKAQAERSR
jgi:hypothetical protein